MRLETCVALSALCAPALAQCDPAWEAAIGNPGILDGYAQPVTAWNGHIYVGGSFSRVGGVSGTRYIGRWEPNTGTWASLAGGLDPGFTNAFTTSIIPFQGRLVVGGFFRDANNVPDTQSLAAWDGGAWSSLGAGLAPPEAVWDMHVWDDGVNGPRLIVVGQFPDIGDAFGVNGIAAYDGSSWHPFGSGVAGNYAPGVFEVAEFNGDLYVGGRFDSVASVNAKLVACYDGELWTRLGSGLAKNNDLAQVSALAVFDDALYIGGGYFRVGGVSCSVAKWDGATLTPVGQVLSGFIWDLVVFDDGNGAALYMGGTANYEVNYLARLEGDTWVPVDGGVGTNVEPPFPSVFGLAVIDDALYIAGEFDVVGTPHEAARGLAVLHACDACAADFNDDGQLNIFDFLAYQAAFGNEDLSADLAPPFGVLNLFDFLAFQTAFGDGC